MDIASDVGLDMCIIIAMPVQEQNESLMGWRGMNGQSLPSLADPLPTHVRLHVLMSEFDL